MTGNCKSKKAEYDEIFTNFDVDQYVATHFEFEVMVAEIASLYVLNENRISFCEKLNDIKEYPIKD